MNSFERALMQRSPLAGCVLESCDFVFEDQFLEGIWDQHRGRCYQDVLKFPDFLRLMRDALIRHGGSAHKLFVDLESRDAEPIDESNFYRKLARTPVALSQALLREGTQRLAQLMPGPQSQFPACFGGFTVVIGDGKKIKYATKRLKPTRGYQGKLLGAKALVALDGRSGLVLAMSSSLDGLRNDVPMVPELLEQLHQVIPGPMLSIWDRQFDDPRTLRRLCSREPDAYLVRMKQKQMAFVVESTVIRYDEQGRQVLDQIGLLSKQRLRVRRITLCRGEGEEDVVLLTNLLDRSRYPAKDLLELYRRRWGIEQVFQQVTETFNLQHLIGCAPKAILLQFSFCLLLYNLMQMVRAYVAEDGGVLASMVSLYYLFDDVRTELTAWAYHTDGSWPQVKREPEAMRQRLRELLKGSWDPRRYTKAADATPRPKPKTKKRLYGGHSSIQRALEGRAKVVPA